MESLTSSPSGFRCNMALEPSPCVMPMPSPTAPKAELLLSQHSPDPSGLSRSRRPSGKEAMGQDHAKQEELQHELLRVKIRLIQHPGAALRRRRN